ncbi:MAG: ABC transporter transmembrane domain-containing protein [Bacillota bacterium]
MEEPWKTKLKEELKKHLPTVLFSSFVAIFASVLNQVSPLLIRWLLNEYLRFKQLQFLWEIIFVICFIPLVLFWIEIRYREWMVCEVHERSSSLNQLIFINLLSQPLTYFDRGRPEETYKQYSFYSRQFIQALIVNVPRCVSKAFVLVFLVAVIALVEPKIAWLQLAFFAILFLFKITKTATVDREVLKVNFLLQTIVEETFKYIKVIKLYNMENLKVKHLADTLRGQKYQIVKKQLTEKTRAAFPVILEGVFLGLSLGIGIKSLTAGIILGGDLLLVALYLPVVYSLSSDLLADRSFSFHGVSQLFAFL